MYEGQVLYVLDAAGKVIERTMYKIKPRDIEEVGRKFLPVALSYLLEIKVHWASFGHLMQGRVREALEKIASREKNLTQETLQQGISSSMNLTPIIFLESLISLPITNTETDMGPKEWDRFGKHVWKYASEMAPYIPPLSVDKVTLTMCPLYSNRESSNSTITIATSIDHRWVSSVG